MNTADSAALPQAREENPRLNPGGHTHRLGPLIILVLAVIALFAALELPFGSVARPGPGLWPTVVAVLTMGLAIGAMLLPRQDEERFTGFALRRVTILFIAVLMFPVLFDFVGFVVPAAALIIFMMRFLSKESWLKSIIVATVTTAVAYTVFGVMLGIRLPAFF